MFKSTENTQQDKLKVTNKQKQTKEEKDELAIKI